MPGYSGTPLPKKLGIKPGFRVHLVNAPAEVRSELSEALDQCSVSKADPLDFGLLFCKSRNELIKQFSPTASLLTAAGMLWVSWPKKASGVVTDLNENFVRENWAGGGLGGCKGVCRYRYMVEPEIRAASRKEH